MPDETAVDDSDTYAGGPVTIFDEQKPNLSLQLDPNLSQAEVTDMAQHMVDHVCVICAQQFNTSEDLQKHFWDHDDNISHVGCLICNVGFPSKDELVDHILRGCHTSDPKTPTSPVALIGTPF